MLLTPLHNIVTRCSYKEKVGAGKSEVEQQVMEIIAENPRWYSMAGSHAKAIIRELVEVARDEYTKMLAEKTIIK